MQVQILKICDINRNSDCDQGSTAAVLKDWLYVMTSSFIYIFFEEYAIVEKTASASPDWKDCILTDIDFYYS